MLSLDKSKNDTSVTLDLLRAIAAQMVCVGHAINFFLGGWPLNFPYMQNVGVLLFFILSGLLITHTLLRRSKNPDYGFRDFFIDRFARIYSGLIPALAFIVVVDWTVIHLTGSEVISRYFTFKTLMANLFMLEGYRGVFTNSLQWSAFGSASPLWTLAIEWHIYMFVGAMFFMVARPRSIPFLIPVALFFGQTALHFLFGAFQDDGVGRGLFALWLTGAAIYLTPRLFQVGYLPAVAIAAVAGAVFIGLTSAGAEYNMLGYPVLVASCFGVVAASQSRRLISSPLAVNTIKFFAGYSFTLYLIHYTIMMAITLLWPNSGWMGFITAIVLSNGVAAAIAVKTEMKHKEFARILSGGWQAITPEAA